MVTTAARRVAAALLGLFAALAFAGVAFAHVEVEANPAKQGSTNAVVKFTAEAESPTSGIRSIEVQLPAGISPQDVRLDQAPSGWQLTATADGYRVEGPALRQGQDAVHSIIVARLPTTATVIFKTVVTYADGKADRWIEQSTAANPRPDHPAPVLNLQPAAGATTTVPGTSTLTPTAPTGAPPGGGGKVAAVLWPLAFLIILGGGLYLLAKRRSARER
jgi:uncharacterized protein YcnI